MADSRKIAKKKDEVFIFEGVDASGKKQQGEISAGSIILAKALLRQKGIDKAKVKKKPVSLFASLGNSAKTNLNGMEVATLTRQLATMAKAGVPLVQSFSVVSEATDSPSVAALMKAIKAEVEAGISFSDALKRHPKTFDELFCNLVAAGEQSGTLDTMLNRVAFFKEKSESLKRKIKKALYYPTAVVLIAGIVSTILLVKVVPTFKSMFASFNAQLPDFTLFVLALSDLLRNYWWQCGGLIGSFGWFFVYFYRTKPEFRNKVQRLSLKLPLFGKLFRKVFIARVTRTLATTFAAGVPLPDALLSVAKAAGNVVYYEAMMRIRDQVSTGQTLNVAMRRANIFPSLVIQMVSIGEEAGSLEEMLSKVATIYEEEVDADVDGLTTLLEPLIMVILGVVVGGLVVAMYLPIFKMGSLM